MQKMSGSCARTRAMPKRPSWQRRSPRTTCEQRASMSCNPARSLLGRWNCLFQIFAYCRASVVKVRCRAKARCRAEESAFRCLCFHGRVPAALPANQLCSKSASLSVGANAVLWQMAQVNLLGINMCILLTSMWHSELCLRVWRANGGRAI
jgi:hypothetical protein